MWPRKYKHASWNGITFNILKTDEVDSMRLDARSLPNRDEPYIKPMGSGIQKIDINAIFIGPNSLADANAFVRKLKKNPEGVLEHPELGELKLVFENVRRTITTTKGQVTLVINFLKQGKPVILQRVSSRSVSSLTSSVLDAGTNQFEQQIQINAANVSEIAQVQDEYQVLLDDMSYLFSQIKLPSDELADLFRQINEVKGKVSSIANDPKAFAVSVNALLSDFSSIANTEQPQTYEAISLERSTNLKLINNEATANTNLLKLQATTTRIKTSRELATVENSQSAQDLARASSKDLNQNYNAINQLKISLGDRIAENTATANYQNMDLVDRLFALDTELSSQLSKVQGYQDKVQTLSTFAPKPSMALAHENEQPLNDFEWLNKSAKHPLFMSGDIKIQK